VSSRVSSIRRWATRFAAASAAVLVLGCTRDADPSALLSSAAGAAAADGGAAPAGAAGTKSGKVADGTVPPNDLPVLPHGGAPPVLLDGSSHAWPPPVPDNVPRIAALAIETPVLAQPDVSAPRLGQLRAGAIVEVDPRPVIGKGCSAGFRAIKPLGFVCLGSTTLDLNHPTVRAAWRGVLPIPATGVDHRRCSTSRQ